MLINKFDFSNPNLIEKLEKRLESIARLREERESHREPNGVGLLNFIRTFWHVLEPTRPFVSGWALEAICEHLHAVTTGDINRLLITVPPGFAKSITTNAFWPAHQWGPMRRPDLRGMSFSYSSPLTQRDNQRFRDIVTSKLYQEMYGDVFNVTADGKIKIQNDKKGWQFASSVGGVSTGERADVLRADDLHSIKDSESTIVREETVRWFRESMSNRLNDMERSAIVVIMQRVNEGDVAGSIISDSDGLGYTRLLIPMEYETSGPWDSTTSIGWSDPRTYDGELAWPQRFPRPVVENIKKTIGPYSYAAQYQQNPEPRGGAIIKRDWWRLWRPLDKNAQEVEDGCPHCGSLETKPIESRAVMFECQDCKQKFRGQYGKFPSPSFVMASLDTAYTEKERNDPSAMTVWGVFRHPKTKEGGVILMDAWRKWLPIRGANLPRLPGEDEFTWRTRVEPQWGLVEWTLYTCRKHKIHHLLIENKASGISLQQELQREYGRELWMTEMVNPPADKEARVHAVVGTFAQGLVWAPNRWWADLVINECSMFPFGKYKDLTDTTSQALSRMRDMGLLKFEDELIYEETESMRYRSPSDNSPLYPV